MVQNNIESGQHKSAPNSVLLILSVFADFIAVSAFLATLISRVACMYRPEFFIAAARFCRPRVRRR